MLTQALYVLDNHRSVAAFVRDMGVISSTDHGIPRAELSQASGWTRYVCRLHDKGKQTSKPGSLLLTEYFSELQNSKGLWGLRPDSPFSVFSADT